METTNNYNPNEGKGCLLAIVLLALIIIALGTTMKGQTSFKLDDKDKHFLVSSNIACASSIVLFKVTDRPVLSCFGGLAISTGIGYAKERFYDGMMHKGNEDYKGDFVVDIIGSLTGTFIAGASMVIRQHIIDKREQKEWEYKQKFKDLNN